MTSTTTCATCPLARLIEGDRYECTSAHKDRVVRSHHQATQDCTDAIEKHRVQLEAAVAVADREHEGGRIAGYYDAKFKTNTILDNDSAEWLEGYWQGWDDYLETLKAKDALHQECQGKLRHYYHRAGVVRKGLVLG